jgi:hypothetical protein
MAVGSPTTIGIVTDVRGDLMVRIDSSWFAAGDCVRLADPVKTADHCPTCTCDREENEGRAK